MELTGRSDTNRDRTDARLHRDALGIGVLRGRRRGLALTVALAFGVAAGYALGHVRVRALRHRLAHERHAARHDPLTGLPNRLVVLDLLDNTHPALVGLCDVDRLKEVNDSFGHDAGDQLLRIVARRLAVAMASSGTAARLGGDEFALIWIHPPTDPLAAATAVLDRLTQPATLAGQTLVPQASLGLATTSPALAGRHLLSAADVAMYHAKHDPAAVHIYDRDTAPPPVDRPTRRRRDRPTTDRPT